MSEELTNLKQAQDWLGDARDSNDTEITYRLSRLATAAALISIVQELQELNALMKENNEAQKEQAFAQGYRG